MQQFACKCLGIVLNKSTSRHIVERHLDLIFNGTNHFDEMEREGCAMAFGYCATNHLDLVLLKLENYGKLVDTKQQRSGISNALANPTGFLLNIRKEISQLNAPSNSSKLNNNNSNGNNNSGPADALDLMRATLALAYGFVTFYAPTELVISRLEANLLRSVVSTCATANMLHSRDTVFKNNLLKSLDLITKCMHADHLNKDFNFSHNRIVLTQIIVIAHCSSSPLVL